VIAAAALCLTLATLAGARSATSTAAPPSRVCAECVKAHMDYLAGDALKGRGCATGDEHLAARYIEGELQRAGVSPVFPDGMRQPVALEIQIPSAPPVFYVATAAGTLRWGFGADLLALGEASPAQGRFLRVTDVAHLPPALSGAVVFYDHPGLDRPAVQALRRAGAALILLPADAKLLAAWSQISGSSAPRLRLEGGAPPPARASLVLLKPAVAKALRGVADGAAAALEAPLGPLQDRQSFNVLGVLHGTDADADHHALMLSAHYDHLGVRDGVIYHGANDDASGTTAVLEFARLLASGVRPRRTVYFALFGCEEAGELGAAWFGAHPPFPVTDLATNLEFEMIGFEDPERPGVLMMTGWDRTNLGPTLAAHGARVGPDLYPEQNFFQRSDNYQLALKGVVAQTVSGWPIPPTYHQPTDTLDHIDLAFMDRTIGSLVGPVRWLVDGDFQPKWNPGMKP
jgi:hypothetical protein